MKRAFVFLIPALLCSQTDPNLQQGRALFRSNCAFCHGMTATGGRGPNLVSAPLSHGDTNDSIKRVIRIGVPGTTMLAFAEFTDEEVAQIIEYLHSLSKGTTRQVHVPGDPAAGKRVYDEAGCAGCHRIGAEGSIYGPDLSRIGAARPVEYIRESVVNPSADVPEAWEGVTVETKDGKRVRGIRVNEDTFSIQLRAPSQKFLMFEKKELRNVTYEKKSLMPAYDKMAAADLQNMIAYLASLRGLIDEGGATKKASGIK